ncbi:MAG: hypothetical protein ACTH4K_10325 [Serratia bockelmannii]
MSRARYQPWNDLPEDGEMFATDMEDRIRFGYPAFNRLPAPGDWFSRRWTKTRTLVIRLAEREDELRVFFHDTARKTDYSLTLSEFMNNHTLTLGDICHTVADGYTPAELLSARRLSSNAIYRMTLATEQGYGRWLGIYRRLGLVIPQKHQWGFCPVCRQRENRPEIKKFRLDPREDTARGICHCVWCGQHSGIELISAARGVSLDEAAVLVLSITGERLPEVRHAQ